MHFFDELQELMDFCWSTSYTSELKLKFYI